MVVARATSPYRPRAGAIPVEFAGRENISLMFERAFSGEEPALILYGPKGVGKSALISMFRKAASGREAVVSDDRDTELAYGVDFTEHTKYAMDHLAGLIEPSVIRLMSKAKGAVRLKPGFLEIAWPSTTAVSLNRFVMEGMAELARKAGDHGVRTLLTYDEMQNLGRTELAALLGALSAIRAAERPFVFVGAGLPTLRARCYDARNTSDKDFQFELVANLGREAARDALVVPAQRVGEDYSDQATEHIFAITRGYPHFIQLFGHILWRMAASSPIDVADVKAALPELERQVDASFAAHYARLKAPERALLRALAAQVQSPYEPVVAADSLGVNIEQVLISIDVLQSEGLLFHPLADDQRVELAFPLFDEYLRRRAPA